MKENTIKLHHHKKMIHCNLKSKKTVKIIKTKRILHF